VNDIISVRGMSGGYCKPKPSDLDVYKLGITFDGSNTDVLDYLKINKNLSDETIKNFKLGYDVYRNQITIPETKNKEIVNIAFCSMEKDVKVKYVKDKGCENWIFNEDAINLSKNEKRSILITGNQFDCMSAWQNGFKTTVSIPYGKDATGAWVELFDTVNKIYMCFENTKASKKFGLEFAERLGIDKCHEIILPEDCKDLNEYFKKNDAEAFKLLIKKARPYYKYTYSGLSDVIENLRSKKEEFLKLSSIPFVEWEYGTTAVLSGVTNIGKCHGIGTKIMMSDGSIKLVEDIKIGDELMGVDSNPRKVLSLARGKENMYRVWERGEYYDVNESHILSLKQHRFHKRLKYSFLRQYEKTLKEFISYKPETRRTFRGWKTSINFSKKEIKLDPYILGVWLGDGTSSKPDITSMDKNIILAFYKFAKSIGCKIRKQCTPNNKSDGYCISKDKTDRNIFLDLLRHYNILNNKHIPFVYKTNSEEVRLQVLAGLIDTDGYLSKSIRGECYEITQKNTELANDIVYLARSLGFRATINKVKKSIKIINFVGEYNQIFIIGDLGRIPVKIDYKKSNFIPKKDYLTSHLEVESLGKGNYYGFTLDGDGLYLLGSFTVTHNTSVSLNLSNELADMGIGSLVLPIERGIETAGKRFLQVRYGKTKDELRNLSTEEWEKIIPDVAELPVYFSNPRINNIEEVIIKAKKLFNVKFIIIDHLDLLVRKSDGKNYNVEMSSTIQNICRIGQENNMIMLVVHHIKKQEGVGAIPKKPSLNDLKGSGSVKDDPEIVIMLSEPDNGLVEVDILKNKGEMGSRIYQFNKGTGVIGKDVTDIPSLLSETLATKSAFEQM
jgi:replicative DNA helicase